MLLEWKFAKQTTDKWDGLVWEGVSSVPDDLGEFLIAEVAKYNPLSVDGQIDGISHKVYYNFITGILLATKKDGPRTFLQHVPLDHFWTYLKSWPSVQFMSFCDGNEDDDEEEDTESDDDESINNYESTLVVIDSHDWSETEERRKVQLVILIKIIDVSED